ncbi:ribosome biogenesis GTPase [Caloramator fervidus]|uniref:Small ribosomal subunit biogenesis GTPase RsgA n=1 Tax=Caloramator fervidus TaxID=29344 RepID=A0A1H5TY63_9CLOT|nr:ribosome small subunit-dependent GTPase A [Caloramator fervidus]SEF67736.1 ribosome biogenesis GTPase [Caloramator fervidus]
MQEGIIVKGIAGFYYVELPDGQTIECRARGKFRKDNIVPLVGDKVVIEVIGSGQGFIKEIKERKSQLIRPPVANVDQVVVVFALKEPDISFTLLDRLLVHVEENNLDCILCFNKSDLDNDGIFEKVNKIYSQAGYKVIKTNALNKEGIDELKDFLKGKISVFAGPSGVGKSTLFNCLQDKVVMQTGSVSEKIGRGRHTTRHAQLIRISDETYLVDTPGFSVLDLSFIEPHKLQFDFREFRDYLTECKFSSCLHVKEKGCAVIQNVELGNISRSRYENYLEFLNEIFEARRTNR